MIFPIQQQRSNVSLRSKSYPTMANIYDRIFKENFLDCTIGLLRKVVGVRNVTAYPLNEKMQYTLELEGDRFFLIDPTGKKKDRYLLHVEWQTTNNSKMPARMLLYHAVRFINTGLPIKSVVIYVGKKPLTMKNKVEHFSLSYNYEIIDLRNWNPEMFLTSNLPEEVIIAVLAGKTEGEKKREVVRKVLAKLRKLLNDDPTELRRRFTQLEVLGRLRDIQSIIIEEEKNMALLSELLDIKGDIRYQQGAEEDKMIIVKNLLTKTDFSVKKIAELVEASASFVLKIKRSLIQA